MPREAPYRAIPQEPPPTSLPRSSCHRHDSAQGRVSHFFLRSISVFPLSRESEAHPRSSVLSGAAAPAQDPPVPGLGTPGEPVPAAGTRAGVGKQLLSQATLSQHAAPVAPDKKHKPRMQTQPHAGSRDRDAASSSQAPGVPAGSAEAQGGQRYTGVTPGILPGAGEAGAGGVAGNGEPRRALGQELGTSSAGSGLTFCRWSAAQKKERNTPLTTSAKQRTRHQPAQTLPPSPTTTSQRSGGSLRECRAQVRKDTPARSFQPNSRVETFTVTFSWE